VGGFCFWLHLIKESISPFIIVIVTSTRYVQFDWPFLCTLHSINHIVKIEIKPLGRMLLAGGSETTTTT
jgi:hypothetical protein